MPRFAARSPASRSAWRASAKRSRRDADRGTEPLGPETAFDVALRYLATRPRTRWELERRLRAAGADDSVVAVVLDRLASIGYADDAAFAAWWLDQRDRHAPRGRRLVEQELRARGVGREVIDALRDADVAEERAPEDGALPTTELERAIVALKRHLRGRPLPTDPKALQRTGMFLVRRGFDPETTRSAIRAAGASAPDSSDE